MSAIRMNAGSTNGMWFFFLALIGSERKEPCRTNKTSAYLCFFSSVRVFKKMQERRKGSKEGQKQKVAHPLLNHGFCFFLQGTRLIKTSNEAFLVYPLLA